MRYFGCIAYFFAYLFVCVLFYMFVCQQENDIQPSWECGITNSLDIFLEFILRNTLTFNYFTEQKGCRNNQEKY